jgi:hypothetical protein
MPTLDPTWLSRKPKPVSSIEPEETPLAIRMRPAIIASAPALLSDGGTDPFILAPAFLTVDCTTTQ